MTARKKYYAIGATVFLWLFFVVIAYFESRYCDVEFYYIFFIPILFCLGFLTWAAFACRKRIPLIFAGAFGAFAFLFTCFYYVSYLFRIFSILPPKEVFSLIITISSLLLLLGLMVGLVILGCKKSPIRSGFSYLLFSLLRANFLLSYLYTVYKSIFWWGGRNPLIDVPYIVFLNSGLFLFLGSILDPQQPSAKACRLRRIGFTVGSLAIGVGFLVFLIGVYSSMDLLLYVFFLALLAVPVAAVLLFLGFLPVPGTFVSMTLPKPVKVPTYAPPAYMPPVQPAPVYPPQPAPVYPPQPAPVYTPQTPPAFPHMPPVFSQAPPVYQAPGMPDLNAADAKLQQLKDMQARGLISQEDYDSMKKQLLGL